ncbi:MAG: hypothetical protein WA949_10385 [Phormidesmis sp.]
MSQEQTTEVKKTTDYQQQLHPWCIVQHLPKMQQRTVARFRRRNDADEHLRVLRWLIPSAQYAVVFDSLSQPDQEKRAPDDSAIAQSPNPTASGVC